MSEEDYMNVDVGKPTSQPRETVKPLKKKKWQVMIRLDYIDPVYLSKIIESPVMPDLTFVKSKFQEEGIESHLVRIENILELE